MYFKGRITLKENWIGSGAAKSQTALAGSSPSGYAAMLSLDYNSEELT